MSTCGRSPRAVPLRARGRPRELVSADTSRLDSDHTRPISPRREGAAIGPSVRRCLSGGARQTTGSVLVRSATTPPRRARVPSDWRASRAASTGNQRLEDLVPWSRSRSRSGAPLHSDRRGDRPSTADDGTLRRWSRQGDANSPASLEPPSAPRLVASTQPAIRPQQVVDAVDQRIRRRRRSRRVAPTFGVRLPTSQEPRECSDLCETSA